MSPDREDLGRASHREQGLLQAAPLSLLMGACEARGRRSYFAEDWRELRLGIQEGTLRSGSR